MPNHSDIYQRYLQGRIQCYVEPSLARQYYTDFSDEHRKNICGESESQMALRVKGLMGLDACIFLAVSILSVFAFGYWSLAIIPLTWIYYVVLKGDASMGRRTFLWPIVLCCFWWGFLLFDPFGGIYGKVFFGLLPLMYVTSLFGYRQASRGVMALAFRNESAFNWLTDTSKGRAVIIVN